MKSYFFTGIEFVKKRSGNAVGVVMVVNSLLAVVALLREVFFALYLGTSSQADALLVAFFIPDTVGNNLLAVAVGVAAVPVFSKLYIDKDFSRLYAGVKGTLKAFGLLSLFLVILFAIFAGEITGSLGKGFTGETSLLCLRLFYIMIPAVVLYPIFTIGSAVMQVFNRFFVPAVGPVLFNLVFLGGIIFSYAWHFSLTEGARFIAFSILTAVLVMAVLVWAAIYILGIFPGRRKDIGPELLSDETNTGRDLQKVFKMFFPYLLVLLTMQSVLYVERYLASQLGTGSVAALNYAYRVAQFPIWVFVLAIGTVALPSLSKSRGLGQESEFKGTLLKSLWAVLIITVPLACVFFLLRIPVVTILLKRGAFDAVSLQVTAGILAGYALAIVGQGIVQIGIRVFLSVEKMKQPLICLTISSLMNIALDFYLAAKLGSAGLGYGAAIGALINAVLMLYFLDKVLELSLKKHGGKVVRLLLANVPLVIVLILCKKLWLFWFESAGLLGQSGYVALVVMAVGISYWFGLRLFKLIHN